jgi:zinc transport system substrate-binding protein
MKLAVLAAALSFWASAAVAEAPHVVVTIKPIHSLVVAVMGDLGTPDLIVRGGASPHTYSLRPSDAAALESADVVFWTGHGLELFLEDSIDTLAPNATIVALSANPSIELLPVREGGAFEAHADEAEGEHAHDDGHEHGEHDMHFWLDPVNATFMLSHIADTLSAADPEHKKAYVANARSAIDRLNALTAAIGQQLAPVKAKPFVVFHDAYQYFERRFGLTIAGSITVTPDTMPGAARIAEIRAKVQETGAACIFSEPQFEPTIIEAIAEGTTARTGALDPEGASLTEGPRLYDELIQALADSLVACLSS